MVVEEFLGNKLSDIIRETDPENYQNKAEMRHLKFFSLFISGVLSIFK